jgi:two-component system, cell cycle sensor histidine kinase and response regulator CckA
MTMPSMTGVELARQMLTIQPNLPIILCTGFSELINDEKAKAMGIKKLLMKPISQNQLGIAIREVLDGANG